MHIKNAFALPLSRLPHSSPRGIGHSGLDRLLQIKVKVRPVETLHRDQTGGRGILGDIIVRRTLDVQRSLALHVGPEHSLSFRLLYQGIRASGAVRPAKLRNAENGLVVVHALARGLLLRAVSEARGGKTALGPAVLDVGEVEVDWLWCSILGELVADIDEGLDGSHINVVHRGEVKNHGAQYRTSVLEAVKVSRGVVVPRTIL
jgi:hypothetical protein